MAVDPGTPGLLVTPSVVTVTTTAISGRLGLALPGWTTSVNPGAPAQASFSVDAAQLQSSMIAALSAPYVAAGSAPPSQVMWYDHDGSVLVSLSATTVTLLDGVVLVAFSLQSDQVTGQVIVALSVGTSASGMLVGTENRPRGLAQLVDRWGDPATAAAWSALLNVVQALAQQGGADGNGAAFIPASITATTAQLSVLPQARQAMDSTGS
jgi:hypothetical protein